MDATLFRYTTGETPQDKSTPQKRPPFERRRHGDRRKHPRIEMQPGASAALGRRQEDEGALTSPAE